MDLEAHGKKKALMEPTEPMEKMDTLEFHLLMLVVLSHELVLKQVQALHLLHKILEVLEDTMDILLFQTWMIMVIFHELKNM